MDEQKYERDGGDEKSLGIFGTAKDDINTENKNDGAQQNFNGTGSARSTFNEEINGARDYDRSRPQSGYYSDRRRTDFSTEYRYSPKEAEKKKKRGSGWKVTAYVVAAALFGGFLGGFFENQLNVLRVSKSGKLNANQVAYLDKNNKIDIDSIVKDVTDKVTKKLTNTKSTEEIAEESVKSVVGITLNTEIISDNPFTFGMRQKVTETGSGVIVDKDGYILTNAHVVVNGQDSGVSVLLYDGSTVKGKVLWLDQQQDLAVVKIEPKSDLSVAKLGDSDELRIGEQVLAIGNPLGMNFQRSVTRGIISGLNRTIESEETGTMENLIQTDASINNGNSGGPLINMQGEVVGINSIKIGNGEGLGFSIPINTAKFIVQNIKENGTFKRLTLGVQVMPYEYYKARIGLNNNQNDGLIILQVEAGSNAQKSGLKASDILLEFDGQKMTSNEALLNVLYKHKTGDKIEAKIIRDGETKTVEIEFSK